MLIALESPVLARAAGQPVLGYAEPGQSVPSNDGTHRYLASPHGSATLLQSISRGGILGHAIPGRFAVPMVALNGSLGGLSGDGRTLVLTRPRATFPETSTELAIVDASSLRLVRVVRLPGDFSIDAVSPDGRWVYLIQYTQSNSARYRVRALDTRIGRLASHEIIDPHDRGEKMQGWPVSRVTSPGGRWAYTLYFTGDGMFVHALDTPDLTARCIDLPALPRKVEPFAVRLRLAGRRLLVLAGRRTLSELDTGPLRVIKAQRVRAASSAGAMLSVAALGAILLALVAAGLVRRRAHR
jgi:hypothetical protein